MQASGETTRRAALFLCVTALLGCDAGTDGLGNGEELEDGLGDFRTHIVRSSTTEFLGCSARAVPEYEESCNYRFLSGPFQTTTVVDISATGTQLSATLTPQRFVVVGADIVSIAARQPVHSSYGFTLRARPVGSTRWRELGLGLTLFEELDIVSSSGIVEGIAYDIEGCQGFSCPTYELQDEPGALVGASEGLEIELGLLPVWNFWDFDEGAYDITFDIETL